MNDNIAHVSREFTKTGIRIEWFGNGEKWFHFGHGMGGKAFDTFDAMQSEVSDWVCKRRKDLIAQANELAQVERFLEKQK